jgi:hypothetical protein
VALGIGLQYQLGMSDLVRLVGSDPIGIVVTRDIGAALRVGPVGKMPEERRLCLGNPNIARDGGMTSRHDGLGFPIERTQELTFPAVPHTGANCSYVDDGQD